MNKSFRAEMAEIGQWWCFHIKYRKRRTLWFDLLAWLLKIFEK